MSSFVDFADFSAPTYAATPSSSSSRLQFEDYAPMELQQLAQKLKLNSTAVRNRLFCFASSVLTNKFSGFDATSTTLVIHVQEQNFANVMIEALGKAAYDQLMEDQGRRIKFPFNNSAKAIVMPGMIGLKFKIHPDLLEESGFKSFDNRTDGTPSVHVYCTLSTYNPFGDVSCPGVSLKICRLMKVKPLE